MAGIARIERDNYQNCLSSILGRLATMLVSMYQNFTFDLQRDALMNLIES